MAYITYIVENLTNSHLCLGTTVNLLPYETKPVTVIINSRDQTRVVEAEAKKMVNIRGFEQTQVTVPDVEVSPLPIDRLIPVIPWHGLTLPDDEHRLSSYELDGQLSITGYMLWNGLNLPQDFTLAIVTPQHNPDTDMCIVVSYLWNGERLDSHNSWEQIHCSVSRYGIVKTLNPSMRKVHRIYFPCVTISRF